MWTSKLCHIRVKHNYWCSDWYIHFNCMESNSTKESTLPQNTFTIGQFTFIISWCTKNKICCIFATWMTSFFLWKCIVSILFVSWVNSSFPLPREFSAFSFMDFNCFRLYAFKDSCIYLVVLQMVQPHIILWLSVIGRSWGGAKERSIVSLIITSFVMTCLAPTEPP